MIKSRVKTKWAKPYDAKGKTTFPAQGCAGVYLIRRGSELVYIGYSASNVYKALYRHFQEWNDRTRDRVTYKRLHDIKVRVVYCKSGSYAAKLERALIIKHRPKDNPDKLRGYQLDIEDNQRINEMDRITARSIPDDVPF